MKYSLKCSENRLIAWVCGGVEQAITSCLRGALPEAKGSGDLQVAKYLKYSNMKKDFLILVAAVIFAAFGCGNRQAGSSADAAIVEVDESWFGVYSYVTPPFTSNSGFTLSYSYCLEIMPDSCIFTGIGIQLYFILRCSVKETAPDVLTVSFHSLIDGGGFYFSKPDFLKLYRRDGKYYFNSPYIEYVDDNLNSTFNIDIEVVRNGENPQPAFVDDSGFEDFAPSDFANFYFSDDLKNWAEEWLLIEVEADEGRYFVSASDWDDVICKRYADDSYSNIQICTFPNANLQQVYDIVKKKISDLKDELPDENLQYGNLSNDDDDDDDDDNGGGNVIVTYTYKEQKHLQVKLRYNGGETTVEIIEKENETKSLIIYSPD